MLIKQIWMLCMLKGKNSINTKPKNRHRDNKKPGKQYRTRQNTKHAPNVVNHPHSQHFSAQLRVQNATTVVKEDIMEKYVGQAAQ